MRVQLSKEWITGTIQPYGNVREKQVTSLRKKIYDHRDSGSHKQAIELKKEAGNEKLKTVVTDSQKQHEDSTCKVFRTAYYIAECGRGFSQMNIICTPLRTCLAVENISTLLFIAIVGPPLNLWQPLPYVKSWLAKGRHAATDLGKAKSAKPFPEESRVALWKCF